MSRYYYVESRKSDLASMKKSPHVPLRQIAEEKRRWKELEWCDTALFFFSFSKFSLFFVCLERPRDGQSEKRELGVRTRELGVRTSSTRVELAFWAADASHVLCFPILSQFCGR